MKNPITRFSPRKLWTRLTLRDVDFNDNHAAFENAYLMEDPHNLKAPKEANRFAATNEIIQTKIGAVDKILEIGCGEGAQSRYLSLVCSTLYGIDVSARAVERARINCPKGNFSVHDIFSVEGSFNLVVACEVLYYMSDIPAALDRMSQLGSACLVTYWEKYINQLDRYFANISNENMQLIRFENTTWKAVWWKGKLITSIAPTVPSSWPR